MENEKPKRHPATLPADTPAEREYMTPAVHVPGCVEIRVCLPVCGNVEKFRVVEFLDETGRVLLRAVARVPAACLPGAGVGFRLDNTRTGAGGVQ